MTGYVLTHNHSLLWVSGQFPVLRNVYELSINLRVIQYSL